MPAQTKSVIYLLKPELFLTKILPKKIRQKGQEMGVNFNQCKKFTP
ncbi:Uncharacterized protein ChrSV_0559 [Chromobacterium vaccinii]|nr:Uncharacterized protein ChrSW_0559 [Chromobacterium vaccinii]QND88018.1 Uncharacterized protein ChrSV_0559 [Chromobacterium vaccinii]